MPPVIATTDVDRAADVFAYATDPAGSANGKPASPKATSTIPALRRPARGLTTRRIGGASRTVTSEVTHLDPPHTWGVRGIDGPIRATVDLTTELLTGSTSRLTIAVDSEGHGIGKVLVPLLVRRQARKEMPANIAPLKRRIEAQQPDPGP